MYTPSHTKLKGDLLLELKEIRDLYSIESSKLETVQRQRREAESGFQEREKRVLEREKINNILEEKFNSVANDADLYLENLERELRIKKEEIKGLEKTENNISDNIKIIEEKKNKITKQLDKEIEDKRAEKNSINKEVESRILELEPLKVEKNKLLEKNKIIKEDNEIISAKLSERELKVTQREVDSERRNSELRVWSVRLHNKYGKYMTETENVLIPK